MMTYRTLLRTKVVQMFYAFESNGEKSLSVAESELQRSIDKTTELYYHLLNLSVMITRHAAETIEAARNKFRPTAEERNPNMKFVNNLFVRQITENPEFAENVKHVTASWESNPEILKSLYENITESEFYAEYMAVSGNDFDADKALWRTIYEQLISENEDVDEAIEDQNLYWADDVDLALSFVVKTIKQLHATKNEPQLLPKICKEDDVDFARELFANVVTNKSDYRDIISRLSQHWDSDRIAFMDILVMEVAIAELMTFPTIPVNVTINEYIEIAKKYSTDRSHIFINGILDKAVDVLKNEKNMIKVEMPRFK